MNNEQIPQELKSVWMAQARLLYKTGERQDAYFKGCCDTYLTSQPQEYLSQSSQPKGEAKSVEEFLIMSIRQNWPNLKGDDHELWGLFVMLFDPPIVYKTVVKAMQSYASQQCAEKDKEIAELKVQGREYEQIIRNRDKEIAELTDEIIGCRAQNSFLKEAAEHYTKFTSAGDSLVDAYLTGRRHGYIAMKALEQSSQPKGAEEGETVEAMVKYGIPETDAKKIVEKSRIWNDEIYPHYLKGAIFGYKKAMQSYASQQLSEKDKEIAELKKSQQPEVSEDKMKVLDILLFDFGDDYFRQGGPNSLFSFSDWRKKPKVQKLYSQLFEPQPVADNQPEDNAFEQFYLWKRERSIRGESPVSFTHWYRTEYLKPEPQPVQGESDGWVRVEDVRKVLLNSIDLLGYNEDDYAVGEGNIKDACCEIKEFLDKLPSPPKANK
jgi:hypothetical protein